MLVRTSQLAFSKMPKFDFSAGSYEPVHEISKINSKYHHHALFQNEGSGCHLRIKSWNDEANIIGPINFLPDLDPVWHWWYSWKNLLKKSILHLGKELMIT